MGNCEGQQKADIDFIYQNCKGPNKIHAKDSFWAKSEPQDGQNSYAQWPGYKSFTSMPKKTASWKDTKEKKWDWILQESWFTVRIFRWENVHSGCCSEQPRSAKVL